MYTLQVRIQESKKKNKNRKMRLTVTAEAWPLITTVLRVRMQTCILVRDQSLTIVSNLPTSTENELSWTGA